MHAIDGSRPLLEVAGAGTTVPVWRGTAQAVNLDNAASTPPARRVQTAVTAVMECYGSIHRGDGFASAVSTRLLEKARARILAFAGARSDDMAIFTQNSTASLNVLARRFAQKFGSGFPVIVSQFEHSSNLLPWIRHGQIHTCGVKEEGEWELDELRRLLKSTKARVVSITAASNVTGRILDVASVARIAHSHGARVAVDASQFAAHRSIRSQDERSKWDFVVFAGHKMYAPYGTAVLVCPRDFFEGGWPDQPGGGAVRLIDNFEMVWADLPDRENTGTVNYAGIVALAEACAALEDIGFERLAEHERRLMEHAGNTLGTLKGVKLHRPSRSDSRWLPVFPFSVEGYHHSLMSVYLGVERAIAVRSGHLCQFELVRQLVNVTLQARRAATQEARSGNLRNLYGVVRASAGAATTLNDLDRLTAALTDLLTHGPRARYTQSENGQFHVDDWQVPRPQAFDLSWA